MGRDWRGGPCDPASASGDGGDVSHHAYASSHCCTSRGHDARRFFFGVGTGENLNEHITGNHWPAHDMRLAMLEEAVDIIRHLWQGTMYTYRGCYYTIENARLYTLPDELPPLLVAASGPNAAEAAGRISDGFINTAPQQSLLEHFDAGGGAGKPRYVQMSVCWAEDAASARRTAYEYWPNAGITGELSQELPRQRNSPRRRKWYAKTTWPRLLSVGPTRPGIFEKIQHCIAAGYDHVYIHQIGPDQEGFSAFIPGKFCPKFR